MFGWFAQVIGDSVMFIGAGLIACMGIIVGCIGIGGG